MLLPLLVADSAASTLSGTATPILKCAGREVTTLEDEGLATFGEISDALAGEATNKPAKMIIILVRMAMVRVFTKYSVPFTTISRPTFGGWKPCT